MGRRVRGEDGRNKVKRGGGIGEWRGKCRDQVEVAGERVEEGAMIGVPIRSESMRMCNYQ